MENKLLVSFSPHIRDKVTVARLMFSVVIALIPALIGSAYFFGFRALLIVILSSVSSLFFEGLSQKLFGRKVTISDGSALVSGILLAFNLPPGVPYFIPIIGAAFAIIIVKQFFGGLGYNFVNPALAARAF